MSFTKTRQLTSFRYLNKHFCAFWHLYRFISILHTETQIYCQQIMFRLPATHQEPGAHTHVTRFWQQDEMACSHIKSAQWLSSLADHAMNCTPGPGPLDNTLLANISLSPANCLCFSCKHPMPAPKHSTENAPALYIVLWHLHRSCRSICLHPHQNKFSHMSITAPAKMQSYLNIQHSPWCVLRLWYFLGTLHIGFIVKCNLLYLERRAI